MATNNGEQGGRWPMDGELQWARTTKVVDTCFGQMTMHINSYWDGDPCPLLVYGVAMMMRIRRKWVLNHLLVEDEYRRRGVGSSILLDLENRYGQFGAAWISDSGVAFAKAFVRRHGERPWQIGGDPAIDAMLAAREANP